MERPSNKFDQKEFDVHSRQAYTFETTTVILPRSAVGSIEVDCDGLSPTEIFGIFVQRFR
jgi:hypothetical protein